MSEQFSANSFNETRLRVLNQCADFLEQYMTEERDKRQKKILAQSLLTSCGMLQHKSRPHQKIRFEILKRDDFKCVYCGRGASEVILEIDHVNPVAVGGDARQENLVTACKDCNIGKRDFLLNERQEEKIILANKEKTKRQKSVPKG